MLGIILLLLGILLNGAGSVLSGYFSIALKPANKKSRSLAELELFNGCFTFVAMLCALVSAVIKGSLYIPPIGLFAALLFGIVFSLCIFCNLKALESGPISLTTLILNFSLVMPLIYGFCFLDEDLNTQRIIGIALFCVCMFLFTNPRITGEKKLSVKWFLLSVGSMLCNGFLSLSSKIYAMASDNAYAAPYLFFSYMFATLTSLIVFFVLNTKQPPENRTTAKSFFNPAMCVVILLVGCANFGLNFVVLLLAPIMDAAIVYPAIQGGGPIFVTVFSRFVFGEEIHLKKALAILLGVIAIVLLNL